MNENIITEAYIIPEDNLIINIDQWKPGNPLWITGSSGDGKSTLAKIYGDKYNAFVCSTDILLLRLGKQSRYNKYKGSINHHETFNIGENLVADYVKTHPDIPYIDESADNRFPPRSKILRYIRDMEKWIYENINKPIYRKKIFVIEGCDICELDPYQMAQRPLIIVGGSRLRSFIRRVRRNKNDKDPKDQKTMVYYIFDQMKKYTKIFHKLDVGKERFQKQIEYYQDLLN